MTTEIVRQETSISDLERMAQHMVASNLFGIKTKEQAVALMLISQAEGMHPALAARDYHIIQGRHTLKADAMLARFQASGGKVEWQEYSDTRCAGIFSHPQSPKPVLIDWDMNRAKQAGIGGKDNWNKYPRQMLKARVVSDGVRLCFPGCAVGVYTPEEVIDFDSAPAQNVRPMQAAEPVKQIEAQQVQQAEPAEPPQEEAVQMITEAQRKLLFAALKRAGGTPDAFKAYLVEKFAISSTTEIPSFLFNQIKEEIEAGCVKS